SNESSRSGGGQDRERNSRLSPLQETSCDSGCWHGNHDYSRRKQDEFTRGYNIARITAYAKVSQRRNCPVAWYHYQEATISAGEKHSFRYYIRDYAWNCRRNRYAYKRYRERTPL